MEQFIKRNLGDEVFYRLIEPFCSGVYAGDPSKLSMKAAFGRVGFFCWHSCLGFHWVKVLPLVLVGLATGSCFCGFHLGFLWDSQASNSLSLAVVGFAKGLFGLYRGFVKLV